MGQERRIHSRLRTRVPARVVRGTDHVEGLVENIGEGGVFFATEVLEVPLDDGSDVSVEFDATWDGAPTRMRVPGTVLRSERYFDGTAVVRAFAIRFHGPLDIAKLTV